MHKNKYKKTIDKMLYRKIDRNMFRNVDRFIER